MRGKAFEVCRVPRFPQNTARTSKPVRILGQEPRKIKTPWPNSQRVKWLIS